VDPDYDAGAPRDAGAADIDEVDVDSDDFDDSGLEAPDPIVPSISADSTEGRAY
jgi:hypothetical protein